MKKKRTIIRYVALAVIVLGGCGLVMGQSVAERSGETLKLASLAYQDLRFLQASRLYESYSADKLTGEELKKLADCYWQMREYDKCLQTYLQYRSKWGDNFTDREKIRIGEVYARQGNYAQASKWLEQTEGYSAKAQAYSPSVIPVLIGDSSLWKVGYLNLNTGYREFAPYLNANTLFFSGNRPFKTKKEAFGWDGENFSRLWQIPVSKLSESAESPSGKQEKVDKGKEGKAKKLSKVFEGADVKATPDTKYAYLPRLYVNGEDSFPGSLVEGFSNLKYNVGGIAISGDSVIYFSSNYKKSNKQKDNRLHMMQGTLRGTSVSNIHSLPFGEDTYSVMHPAISADGLILVFSSDKQGGQGQYDLYYSTRQSLTSPWRDPLFVPGSINTKGNEVFPSITADGYLYFSSDSKQGLGGLDIYRVKLGDALAGTGREEHLPSPVNSSSDDFGWTQTGDGKVAYFTSDRKTEEDNIYSARYDEEAAKRVELGKLPRKLEGFVLDRQTMEPFPNATVFLLNKCDNKVYITRTDDKGKYTYPVTASCEVVILGASKGYSKDCLSMKTVFDQTSSVLVQKAPHDLLLDRYTQNMKWRVNNIHYDFDKWNIRADARPILDTLVAMLKEYPVKVELGSHTDSRGTFAYNDRLSQRRAESAVAYIVSKGIDPSRIMAKGYGEHQLLNKCSDGVPCSEAAHQENRRTEVKVLAGPTQNMSDGFDPSSFEPGQTVQPEQLPKGFFDNCK